MNPKLVKLREEDAVVRSAIATLNSQIDPATGETEEQSAEMDVLHARAEAIATEVEPLIQREEALARSAAVIARVTGTPSAAPANVVVRSEPVSVVDYLTNLGLGRKNSSEGADARQALVRSGHFRAVEDQVTDDFEVGEAWTGEILKIADVSRPVFESFTQKPFIPAMQVARGLVTQRTLVEEQLTQKAELASRPFQVEIVSTETRTFGGTLDIARQYFDLLPAQAVAELIQDFADTYNDVTEGAAEIFLSSTAGASVAWNGTSVSTVGNSIKNAVAAVYASGKAVPATLWLSLDEALDLAFLYNTAESDSAMERLTASLRGVGINLDVVLAPKLPSNTRILGLKSHIWVREQKNGIASAPNIARHGVDMNITGYLNFDSNPEFFVKLV